jgi:multidrug resistance efflux pump
MKSLNFKRKDDSYLRYLEETKVKKSKSPRNWDRIIYLSLLVVFSIVLIRYLFKSTFYIEGNGQVLFEKVDIRHTDDIRILEFYKQEGDDVKIGDTLFTYFLDDDLFGGGGGGSGSNSVSISTAGKSNSWIDREIYVLKKNVDLNKVKINDANQMLNLYKADLVRVQNEVILDAVSHTNLENLEYRIEKLEGEINLFSAENSIFRKQLGYLYKLKEEEDKAKKDSFEINQASGEAHSGVGSLAGQDLLAGINQKQGFNYFTCPIQGNITRIAKQAFEVALKSEIIMALHQPKYVHIRGYFDQKDLNDLHVGDVVDIEFPDGTKSAGFVKRFEFSTRILPEEFQKKFEPTTRTLAVDILPLNENDLDIWKKYFKLSVKITKRTF